VQPWLTASCYIRTENCATRIADMCRWTTATRCWWPPAMAAWTRSSSSWGKLGGKQLVTRCACCSLCHPHINRYQRRAIHLAACTSPAGISSFFMDLLLSFDGMHPYRTTELSW
jgi:hypothetical protein